MSALIFALGVCAVAYGAWNFNLVGLAGSMMDFGSREITTHDKTVLAVIYRQLATAVAFQVVGIAAIVVAFL